MLDDCDLGPPGIFTLGTVQLGQAYGLGAAQSLLSDEAAAQILDAAATAGVSWLDTARAYGEAEARIGRWTAIHGPRFRVVSKVPSLTLFEEREQTAAVVRSLEQSRAHLGLDQIDVYLTHSASDLLRPNVAEALRRAQSNRQIGRFGASVYTLEEARALLEVPDIAALQIPLNVLSCSAGHKEIIARAAKLKVAVFARSVFLQGALLLPPAALPDHLRSMGGVNGRLRTLADEARVSLPSLLIASVQSIPGIYSVVLGVDGLGQLAELVEAARCRSLDAKWINAAFNLDHGLTKDTLDPRQWPTAIGRNQARERPINDEFLAS